MEATRPNIAPLAGIRVLEFAGLGPAPYGGMLLADLGADVLLIERPGPAELFGVPDPPVDRGKRSLALDLKQASSVDLCLRIIEKADVLIEGLRPGVMERLGLGPDVALARNPRLIYARMTGWGQNGPIAQTAGHDLTFLALTGALHAIGPADGLPVPPLNFVGDMGGGGTFLVIGILAALLERQKSGLGQVIDAAIVDGAVSQLAMILGLRGGGLWDSPRGENLLDGGLPFLSHLSLLGRQVRRSRRARTQLCDDPRPRPRSFDLPTAPVRPLAMACPASGVRRVFRGQTPR